MRFPRAKAVQIASTHTRHALSMAPLTPGASSVDEPPARQLSESAQCPQQQLSLVGYLGWAGMGTLLVLLVGFCVWRFYWGHHTRAARNKFERRVREAVDTLSPESLKFPATFVRGTDFIKQGRLRTYEELRDDGLLVSWDAGNLDVETEEIIFLSQCVAAACRRRLADGPSSLSLPQDPELTAPFSLLSCAQSMARSGRARRQERDAVQDHEGRGHQTRPHARDRSLWRRGRCSNNAIQPSHRCRSRQ